jgi:hypothetical protein
VAVQWACNQFPAASEQGISRQEQGILFVRAGKLDGGDHRIFRVDDHDPACETR